MKETLLSTKSTESSGSKPRILDSVLIVSTTETENSEIEIFDTEHSH